MSKPAILMLLCAIATLTARSGWTHEPFLGPAEIVVRTYDPQHLVGERIIAARHAATAILRQSGVSLRWWHCHVADAAQDFEEPCHDALRPNDVVVRLVRAPFSATRNALGFSLIDRDTDRSWLATVFVDRVIATAQRLRLNTEVLLGRAIAHELGHLLLNSSAHAKSGLMQAVWSDAKLTRHVSSDWIFDGNRSVFVRRNAGGRMLLAMRSVSEPQ